MLPINQQPNGLEAKPPEAGPSEGKPVKANKDPNNHKLSDELKKCILETVERLSKEDSWVRKQQIKMWKKNDEFWHSVQFIFWSESKQDWISPAETRWFEQEEGREESEGPFYDFVFNIYKAHGESIIAALSSNLPSIKFPPDDAEDADDVTTSKTFEKIATLIQRHNKAKIFLLRALLTLWNHGINFTYCAPRTDKAFGKLKIPKYKQGLSCPQCNMSKPKEEQAEGMPEGPEGQADMCPTCGVPLEEMPVLDGFDEAPKTRIILENYSPLFVKTSYYNRDNKNLPYLILSIDQPCALLKELYPHVADDIDKDFSEAGQYERMARTPSSYSSYSRVDENMELRTLQRVWFPAWQFNSLSKEREDERDKLKKLFPNGCYCAFIGKTYVESRDEDMEKYWTVGQAGLSQYIHSDALGQPLIPIQEMKNVLGNLTIETIEQGIPSTFADSKVVNFEEWSRHEARPGMLYPATAKAGQNISTAFYEGGRATLSKEVPMFSQQLDTLGQFLVGSFPSLFGGPSEGKSRTAAEYNMSQQMARQRLSLCWTFICDWWARLMDKATHLYVENMVEDERFTQHGLGKDDYVNVWIRRAELTGHVGEVEVEASETFPSSTPQREAKLMKFIELNNDFLNQALYSTDNRSELAEDLGFPDFVLPGEDQVIKQKREIQAMLRDIQPIPIEPLIDDDTIHANVLRRFLITEGMDTKSTNPQGYQACLAHLQMHVQNQQQIEQANLMKQAALGAAGNPNGGAPAAPQGVE